MPNEKRSDSDPRSASPLDEGGISLFCLWPDAPGTDDGDVSDDERRAAARMVSVSRRQTFLRTRALLRSIIGSRIGCAPRDVPIVLTPTGQPVLDGVALAFSIAHARGLSMIALAAHGRVGLDVERRGDRPRAAAAAETVLPRGWEIAAVAGDAASPDDRFLHAWTRNEALVKATGQGLVFPADQRVPDGDGLQLQMVAIDPAYLVALAADGPIGRLQVADIPQRMRRAG